LHARARVAADGAAVDLPERPLVHIGRAAKGDVHAEAAVVVATNVAKEAARLLVWRVKTAPLR
jgi:hypothetical protein